MPIFGSWMSRATGEIWIQLKRDMCQNAQGKSNCDRPWHKNGSYLVCWRSSDRTYAPVGCVHRFDREKQSSAPLRRTTLKTNGLTSDGSKRYEISRNVDARDLTIIEWYLICTTSGFLADCRLHHTSSTSHTSFPPDIWAPQLSSLLCKVRVAFVECHHAMVDLDSQHTLVLMSVS